MKLVLDSTDMVARIDGVAVRVWKGTTEGGVEVVAYVHQLAVQHGKDAPLFDAEVKQLPPGRLVDLSVTLLNRRAVGR